MQGTGELKVVNSDKLLVVSNVRSGELPNIESLADSIRARGIIAPLIVFNVKDNIDVLSVEIPKLKKRALDAKATLDVTDESEMPEEYVEAQMAFEGQEHKLRVAQDDMDKLKSVSDPKNVYRIVDGHRRFAAGIMAEEEDFQVIIYPAVPDTSDIIFDQIATGMEQQSLSPVDEGRAYRHLERMGLTRSNIAARIGSGVSRSTILQRIKFLDLAEKSQEIASPVAEQFHDALETGNVKVQVANKMAQYLDRQDLTDKDFEGMMETAMTDISGEDFVENINKKHGARKGVTTSEKPPKGPEDDSKGKDNDNDDANDPDKMRRRSEKELAERKEMFTTLLSVCEEAKKKKKSSITDKDIKYLEGVVSAYNNAFGGPEPSVPAGLQSVYERLQKDAEEKKNVELVERKKAKDSRRETQKKVKSEENLAKKTHRNVVREHYNMFVKPAKLKIDKIRKQVIECDVLAEQNPDEADKHLQQKVVLSTTLSSLEKLYTDSLAEWNATKEPWFVDEEKSKIERKKKKEAEAKAEAAAKGTEGSDTGAEGQQ